MSGRSKRFFARGASRSPVVLSEQEEKMTSETSTTYVNYVSKLRGETTWQPVYGKSSRRWRLREIIDEPDLALYSPEPTESHGSSSKPPSSSSDSTNTP